MSESSRKLMERYFGSWPRGDFEAMRACLADHVTWTDGPHSFSGTADEFKALCASGPRWLDVKLLSSVVVSDRAALLYEATSTGDGGRMRVGEFVRIDSGRIADIQAVVTRRSS